MGTPEGVLAGTVAPPTYHFSSVIYPSMQAYESAHHERYGQLIYGRVGSPTLWALEDALCELEGAHDAVLVPSGLAAIHLALASTLSAGDHLLVTDAVYPPVKQLCKQVLSRWGIEVEYYDPLDLNALAALLKSNTRVVYAESPASHTLEIQDLPGLCHLAHQNGARVVVDNTWATPLFQKPFLLGADIVVHAGTKYLVGHSDAMMGVVLSHSGVASQVRNYWSDTGSCLGPDDAALALRGLRTLDVRLQRHQQNALRIGQWLEQRAEVARVLYPALPSHPQHDLWRQVDAFADALKLFGIGASWGGFESLVLTALPQRGASSLPWPKAQYVLRLHIGLEHIDDLLKDLDQAFDAWRRA
jgi:cystathionine beta-lyase